LEFFTCQFLTKLTFFQGFVELPTQTEPFHVQMRKWISDDFFAEQRLAGLNPMTLKKVTFSDESKYKCVVMKLH
jgi:hypothetical protein